MDVQNDSKCRSDTVFSGFTPSKQTYAKPVLVRYGKLTTATLGGTVPSETESPMGVYPMYT